MLHTRIVIPGFDTTDNYYVTMLYNYGLFGLTGMILSIIWVVKNFFKSRSISAVSYTHLDVYKRQC